MVFDRGQVVALALAGGGALVAAVVLGYLIKKYRDATKKAAIDDDDDGDAIPINEKDELPSLEEDALIASKEVSRESTPTSDAWTAGDFRPTFELERPLDFVRLSLSSGITEVESPSFEELMAIEREVGGVDEERIVSASNGGRLDGDYVVSDVTRSTDECDRPLEGFADAEMKEERRVTKAADGELDGDSRYPASTNATENENVDEVFGKKRSVGLVEEYNFLSNDSIISLDVIDGAPDWERTNQSTASFLPTVVTDNLDRPRLNLSRKSPLKLSPSIFSELSPPSPSKLSPSCASSGSSSRSGSATLDDIEEQTTVLSPSESRALVAFLGSANPVTVRRALHITSNAATFPANRYFLRRAGCIPVLNGFLDSSLNDDDVVEASEKALSNLAIDEDNLEYMTESVAALIVNARRRKGKADDGAAAIRSEALICLTNLTRMALHHELALPFVDELLANVDDGSLEIHARLQSLKILINLSLNAAVSPIVLSSRSLTGLNRWLALLPTGKPYQDAAHLDFALNVCHLLSNLLETALGGGDSVASSEEWLDGVVEREETLIGSMASEVKAVTIRSLLFDLNRHPEPDVRFQGKRLYALLAPLWRRYKTAAVKPIVEEEN